MMVLLLAGLAGMMIHYGSVLDRDQSLSEPQSVLDNWESHTGETVYLWASVREIGTDHTVIRTEETTLIVTQVVKEASPGDVIQVYGTARPNHRIKPLRTVVSEARGQQYMYLVSGLAVILTGLIFFRHWRIEWKAFEIQRREVDDA